MSENEEHARRLLDVSIRAGAWIGPAYEVAEVALPALSDAECAAIACNYPLSWQTIRHLFPRPGCAPEVRPAPTPRRRITERKFPASSASNGSKSEQNASR